MTADTPAASKDAPTDEAVMVNIAGNVQDLERAKEHARLLLKRVAAGPVGDGLSHAEYALLCLYAHVATLTAQLEAERDLVASYRHTLLCTNEEKARETARADAAVAEAKALREVIARVEWGGLTQTGYDGDVTSCCPDPACNALINTEHSTDCAIRATLAQPAAKETP